MDNAAEVTGGDTCVSDRDFYLVEVSEPGNLNIMLTYESDFPTRCDIDPCDPADLDIYVTELGKSPVGRGISAEETTEQALIDLIGPGLYVIRVVQYSEEVDIVADYGFQVEFTPGTCENDEDCSETGTRLTCLDAACIPFDGQGQVALGDPCDSIDDCTLDAETCFVGTGPEDQAINICTVSCVDDAGCSQVPGTNCVDTGGIGYCLAL